MIDFEVYCVLTAGMIKYKRYKMQTITNPAAESLSANGKEMQDRNSNGSTAVFPIFRTLFESGRANDFEAMADTLDEDCEWVLMPTMQTFKGKTAIVELCKQGKLASEKTAEIMFDAATANWGVFEYVNRGVITKELPAFAATSGWKFPADPDTLVGRHYEVPVCFVYHTNAEGKIYRLHEYLDLESLMTQLQGPG
jgi:ketosteroid isomerase-like protein